MMNVAWQICRRHWLAFVLLTTWYVGPWVVAALGFDLSHALRFSWIVSAPFAIYMYQLTSGSQLLGILPLDRREVWRITCVAGALAPALSQFVVATAVLFLAPVLLPADTTTTLVGMDTMVLGAVYSLGFLQLVLIVTAALRRRLVVTGALAMTALGLMVWLTQWLPSRLSEFTTVPALAFGAGLIFVFVALRVPGVLAAHVAVTPGRQRATGLRPGLPEVAILNRITGVSRIFVSHALLVVTAVGGMMVGLMLLGNWIEGQSPFSMVTEELGLFGGTPITELSRESNVLFALMWAFGIGNVWTPFARRLRTLPLTSGQTNAIFLLSPLLGWLLAWMMFLLVYTLTVGPVMTPRMDVWLALSGTSAVASVVSLRWKNWFYGMLGMVFVYVFWSLVSLGVLVTKPDELGPLMIVIGVCFHSAAAMLNAHTLRHATSGSPAYQPVPKFLDTPKGV